jgi:hypothetical protein
MLPRRRLFGPSSHRPVPQQLRTGVVGDAERRFARRDGSCVLRRWRERRMPRTRATGRIAAPVPTRRERAPRTTAPAVPLGTPIGTSVRSDSIPPHAGSMAAARPHDRHIERDLPRGRSAGWCCGPRATRQCTSARSLKARPRGRRCRGMWLGLASRARWSRGTARRCAASSTRHRRRTSPPAGRRGVPL